MFLRSAFLFLYTLAVVSARGSPIVYLIRHGEKPADPDDHGLTLDGFRRAQCLRNVFGADSEYDIQYIIAPSVKHSESIPAKQGNSTQTTQELKLII
jgi:hypothetical protein